MEAHYVNSEDEVLDQDQALKRALAKVRSENPHGSEATVQALAQAKLSTKLAKVALANEVRGLVKSVFALARPYRTGLTSAPPSAALHEQLTEKQRRNLAFHKQDNQARLTTFNELQVLSATNDRQKRDELVSHSSMLGKLCDSMASLAQLIPGVDTTSIDNLRLRIAEFMAAMAQVAEEAEAALQRANSTFARLAGENPGALAVASPDDSPAPAVTSPDDSPDDGPASPSELHARRLALRANKRAAKLAAKAKAEREAKEREANEREAKLAKEKGEEKRRAAIAEAAKAKLLAQESLKQAEAALKQAERASIMQDGTEVDEVDADHGKLGVGLDDSSSSSDWLLAPLPTPNKPLKFTASPPDCQIIEKVTPSPKPSAAKVVASPTTSDSPVIPKGARCQGCSTTTSPLLRNGGSFWCLNCLDSGNGRPCGGCREILQEDEGLFIDPEFYCVLCASKKRSAPTATSQAAKKVRIPESESFSSSEDDALPPRKMAATPKPKGVAKPKGAKPKTGKTGLSARATKEAAELVQEQESILNRKTLPSKRVRY